MTTPPYASSSSNLAIRFPWPDRKLSPNSRVDRRGKIRLLREARDMGYFLAVESFPDKLKRMDCWHSVFNPPSRHKNDLDNVLSSCKAVLDGMCQWLELDDGLVKRIILDHGSVVEGGEVVLFVEEL